jgi:hypothetical protein
MRKPHLMKNKPDPDLLETFHLNQKRKANSCETILLKGKSNEKSVSHKAY